MDFKIMVTGRLDEIVGDVCRHLRQDRGYDVVQCFPYRSALAELYLSTLPQVIVLCLRNESMETTQVYDILAEYDACDSATIIVVANPRDKATFVNFTGLKKAFFLPRPISMSALYYKLNELEKEWRESDGKFNAMFTELDRSGDAEPPKKRILIVDDDPEQLAQIKGHLRGFYDATPVSSGKSALRALERNGADLILLDYLMPEMDGPAVFAELKKHEEFKDIPVIFLTGVTEKELVMKTITELMPQGYIIKPAKRSELVARIIEVLG
ncbi:MAG: response regulator [Oscillospiraceae bacterium]|nr:response regulator [Oscillospiraceae bacterium]